LLALPMWLLFELGILLGRIIVRKPDPDEEHATETD
jgi:sec-independent protein translocase protein TatC